MYNIYFYRDQSGRQPVKEYLDLLEEKSKKNKDFRIKYNKIDQYIGILSKYGTMAGEPYMKHLEGEIWELRPLRDRILFFGDNGNSYILLSCFMKRTSKTPKREIEKAKKLMMDYKERNAKDE